MIHDDKKEARGERPSAEERIHGYLRFGSKLGLERMEKLLEKLGHPERAFKVVHIAGTNGKGSVARYIYESLIEEGYKAGLFTSPYLESFNERIEFMRKMIPDDALDVITDEVIGKAEEMVEEGAESPTEFEVVTAICFRYFKEAGCEIAVLEVGLGGRGDSTNVVKDPLISVITSISYDHMDRLGDTIEEIAGEKAGIIKDGSPVVVSTEREEALNVFRDTAKEKSADLFDARELTKTYVKESSVLGSAFDLELDTDKLPEAYRPYITSERLEGLKIKMGGAHQVVNAAEAVLALELLAARGAYVSRESIRKGLSKAFMPGRLEVLYRPPENKRYPWVLIDGAHNKDGAGKLRESLEEAFPKKNILIVTGMLKDKDVDAILDEFLIAGKDFIATEPDNPRKLTAFQLAKRINERGLPVYEVPDPKDAVALAMSIGKGYDAIVFCGSLYLIGRVRSLIRSSYINEDHVSFERN